MPNPLPFAMMKLQSWPIAAWDYPAFLWFGGYSESSKKPRDPDVEDIGDHFQSLDRHVLLPGFDLVDVRTIESGCLGKAILRKALFLPELCNALADHSLNVILQAIRLRVYSEQHGPY